MVEDRRRALTDPELDAALAGAFDAEPSADFAARVRKRIADERIGAPRTLPFFASASVLAAIAVMFVAVMLERRPVVQQPRVTVAAADSANQAIESGRASAMGTAAESSRSRDETYERLARSQRRPQVAQSQESPSSEVLIPAAEQQALRRLFARPPAAVLRLAQSGGDESVAVSAIAIPALEIDPLSPQMDEGGHQ